MKRVVLFATISILYLQVVSLAQVTQHQDPMLVMSEGHNKGRLFSGPEMVDLSVDGFADRLMETNWPAKRAEILAEIIDIDFDKAIDAFIKTITHEGVDEESFWNGAMRGMAVLESEEFSLGTKIRIIQAIAEKGEILIVGHMLLEERPLSAFKPRTLESDIVLGLDEELVVRILDNCKLYENKGIEQYQTVRLLQVMSEKDPDRTSKLATQLTNVTALDILPTESVAEYLEKLPDNELTGALNYIQQDQCKKVLPLLYQSDPLRIKKLVTEYGLNYGVLGYVRLEDWATDYCLDCLDNGEYKLLEKLDLTLIAVTIEKRNVSVEKIVDVFVEIKPWICSVLMRHGIKDVNLKVEIFKEFMSRDKDKASYIFAVMIESCTLSSEDKIEELLTIFSGLEDEVLAQSCDKVFSEVKPSWAWQYFEIVSAIIWEIYKENPERSESIAAQFEYIPIPSLTSAEKTAAVLEKWIAKERSYSNPIDKKRILTAAMNTIDFAPISVEKKLAILSHLKKKERHKIASYSNNLHLRLEFAPETLFSEGADKLGFYLAKLIVEKELSEAVLTKLVEEFEKTPLTKALKYIEDRSSRALKAWLLTRMSPKFRQQIMQDSKYAVSCFLQKEILRPEFNIDIVLIDGAFLDQDEIAILKAALSQISPQNLKYLNVITVIGNERFENLYGKNGYLDAQFRGVAGAFCPGINNVTLCEGQLSERGMKEKIRIPSTSFINELVTHEFWHGVETSLSEEEWGQFVEISGWRSIGYYDEVYFDNNPENKTVSSYNINPREEFAEAGTHLELGAEDSIIEGKPYKGVWTRAREALEQGDFIMALQMLFVRWVPKYSREKFSFDLNGKELSIEEVRDAANELFMGKLLSQDEVDFMQNKLDFIYSYYLMR